MTANTRTTPPEPKATSRRALLAGVVGGLGAWAASAIGRTSPVRATEGDVIHAGDELSATSVTKLTTTTDTAVWGVSTSQGGVRGTSSSYIGVYGISSTAPGVYGQSSSGIGIYGYTNATNKAAIFARNPGNGTGVQGASGNVEPPAKANTGVHGYAAQDVTSKGVWGESPTGRAVQGTSATGWAGYFDGKVLVKRYAELVEIDTPGAPRSNHLRLFARDHGGKTQLCVRFHNGTIRVVAEA